MRDDHYCRECMGRCELVSAAYKQGRREAREEALKIWHGASEEMPAHGEIIAVHKNCISIGDKHEIGMISSVEAWCTRDDLVRGATEAAKKGDTDAGSR